MHRKKQILVGRWPYATKNPNCSTFTNHSVAGTPSRRDEREHDQPDVQDVLALPETVPDGDDQYHHQHYTSMHPYSIEHVSSSNNRELEHDYVHQQQDGLGCGHGAGIDGGADGYWHAAQYPFLTHHNSSLNITPGTGLGWVALDAPVGLWPATARYSCSNSKILNLPQSANAL